MTSVKSKKTKQIGIDGPYDKWQAGSFVDLNDKSFAFKNGLWKGKSNKLSRAVVIRGANFRPNGKMDSGELLELFVDVKQLSDRRLVEGDILIERSGGGPKQPVGRVAYFDMENAGIDYSFSNFTTRLRILDKKRIYPKFIFYRLLHFYATALGASFQSGSTGIRNLDFSKYKTDAKIPLLEISEQKKIAGVLSGLQKTVENQEKIISGLRELKAATMAKLFREGLRGEPLKNTEIGEIPRSWRPAMLSEVCGDTGTLNPAKTPEKIIEYVDVSSVSREECRIVSSTRYKGGDAPGRARNLVEHRDVIFATVRPTLRRVALIPNDLDGQLVSTAFCVIRAIEPRAYPEYLYYVVSSPAFIAQVGRLERGANYPAVTDTNVLSQKIPLPDYGEQKEIASELMKIDKALSTNTEKAKHLTDLFTVTLNQLMTGKVRV